MTTFPLELHLSILSAWSALSAGIARHYTLISNQAIRYVARSWREAWWFRASRPANRIDWASL